MGLRSMSSSEVAVTRVGTVRRVARRAGKKKQMKRRIGGEQRNGKGEKEVEKEKKKEKENHSTEEMICST